MSNQKKKSETPAELPSSALRWFCDPVKLGFDSTETVETCFDIIGQKRALDALRLGFDIDSQGYNIFVAGQVGTGRKSAINCLVNETTRLKNRFNTCCQWILAH